jgi:hypothetical protein
VDPNDPNNKTLQHNGIVASKPEYNAATHTWKFQIFHSLEKGFGPDAVTMQVHDGRAYVFGRNTGPDNPYTYYLAGIYRPKIKCLCEDGKRVVVKPDFVPTKRYDDPLILDLDGGGIETVSLSAGIHFDHDGNGFRELTGWAGPGAGFLMVDRNGNGRPDNGTELFGDFTLLPNGMRATNGFQALAYYDANHDGKIDGGDPIWSQLRIWQNEHYGCDFVFDVDVGGQIASLDELGITAIYLDSIATNRTDSAGNTEIRSSHFQWQDGRSGAISEYRLQRDTSRTEPVRLLDVPSEIAALPDLHGYGNVCDLHQAMVRDSSGRLKTLVEAFVSETSPANRAGILDQIILKWTGADSVTLDARGPFMDGRKVVALEKFYGDQPVNPDAALATAWTDTYRDLFEAFYGHLMAQTHLKDLYSRIAYVWDDVNQEYKRDTSGLIAALRESLASNPEQGQELLSEFARSRRGMGFFAENCFLSVREAFIQQDPDLGWVIDTGGLPVYDHPHQGIRPWSPHIEGTHNADAIRGSRTEGDGYLNGLNGNDVIYGTTLPETLINETGDALLVGGGGGDIVWAGSGSDIVDGGPDNDLLFGEAGNDTYIFRRGSGQDTISDYDATPNNMDTIWLGSNLTPEDIILKRLGYNLVLKIEDTSDTLTVRGFFSPESSVNRIERIQFMDGTVWTDSDIIREVYAPTDGDDTIYGGIENDELNSLGGNDTIYGRGGDDTLEGGPETTNFTVRKVMIPSKVERATIPFLAVPGMTSFKEAQPMTFWMEGQGTTGTCSAEAWARTRSTIRIAVPAISIRSSSAKVFSRQM